MPIAPGSDDVDPSGVVVQVQPLTTVNVHDLSGEVLVPHAHHPGTGPAQRSTEGRGQRACRYQSRGEQDGGKSLGSDVTEAARRRCHFTHGMFLFPCNGQSGRRGSTVRTPEALVVSRPPARPVEAASRPSVTDK